jgi:hypothetical protein
MEATRDGRSFSVGYLLPVTSPKNYYTATLTFTDDNTAAEFDLDITGGNYNLTMGLGNGDITSVVTFNGNTGHGRLFVLTRDPKGKPAAPAKKGYDDPNNEY